MEKWRLRCFKLLERVYVVGMDNACRNRTAAAPAAVSGATRPRYGDVSIRNRGRLPHWERDGGCYFVTFRLADSLPRKLCLEIADRKKRLAAAIKSGRKLLSCEQAAQRKFGAKQFEAYLDAGRGACSLRDTRIANVMADTLILGDGERYRLLAWCVMPNHVHVVLKLFPGHNLSTVMSSWKSYTAKAANRILCRTGRFWQREYYDRLIRDGNELGRAVSYVLNNPEKVGLQNWKWSYVADGV